MYDIFDAVELLKEYCAQQSCVNCVFNRSGETGCFDYMLTNESPCRWNVTECEDEDDDEDY